MHWVQTRPTFPDERAAVPRVVLKLLLNAAHSVLMDFRDPERHVVGYSATISVSLDSECLLSGVVQHWFDRISECLHRSVSGSV